MRRFIIFLFSLPLFLLFAGVGDETPEEILRKVEAELKKHGSMSYEVVFRQKYSDSDDTVVINAQCELIRVQSDGHFGGAFRFTPGHNQEKVYDLEMIFSISHEKKEAVTFDPDRSGTAPVTGNVTGRVIDVNFFHPERLLDLFNEVNEVSLEGEEVIEGKACWRIRVGMPDNDEGWTELTQRLWIDRKTFLPVRKIFSAKFQGNYHYSEWALSNVRFDETDLNAMKDRNDERLREYVVTAFQPRTAQELKLLDHGSVAPDFDGVRYGSETNVRLSEGMGKVTVLDFWYMSCFPCIKAIPHLDSIYRKYADDGVIVWGVNSIDSREEAKKKFPQFLLHNPISYPVVFTDRAVDSMYNVTGYPTLYVLNEKREVVFTQSGFSASLAGELEAVIRRELGL